MLKLGYTQIRAGEMDTHHSAIRVARKRKGWTQQELAEKLGVTNTAVCGWEIGQYEPMPRMAIRLTKLLPGLRFEAIYPPAPAAPIGQAA